MALAEGGQHIGQKAGRWRDVAWGRTSGSQQEFLIPVVKTKLLL